MKAEINKWVLRCDLKAAKESKALIFSGSLFQSLLVQTIFKCIDYSGVFDVMRVLVYYASDSECGIQICRLFLELISCAHITCQVNLPEICEVSV